MVRGGNVMAGYHNLAEETSKTIINGWLHTGDLGKIDVDGFITITGRKKDLIISAGENIYPREIEEILAQHPKVKECAVIGVKDDVREVKAGLECGIKLAGYDDIKVGDVLEGYVTEEFERTL